MPKLTDDCKDRLNHAIPISSILKRSEKYPSEYDCPDPNCDSHGHHVKVFPETNTATCMKCRREYDLISAIQVQNNNADFMDVCKEISNVSGIPLEYETPPDADRAGLQKMKDKNNTTAQTAESPDIKISVAATENPAPKRKPNTPGKYQDKIEKAAADLYTDAGRPALEYLYNRGLTDETIKTFHIGYSPSEFFPKAQNDGVNPNQPALIFPHKTDNSYYSARSIDGKYFTKPSAKDNPGDQPLYNPAALYKDKPAFIVEGQIDALSIIQAGGNAAAITGKEGVNILTAEIENMPQALTVPIILMLDNDPDGQAAQKKLAAALTDKNIPFINANIDRRQYDGPAKDANDLLQADPDKLRQDIRQNEKRAQRLTGFIPYQVDEYLNNGVFDTDIDYFKQYKDRKTGFKNLDKYLTLYPGMISLGGAASVGKTSFAVQLCDNLIEAGQTVLYFALEQDAIELTTKSLARKLYDRDPATQITNIDIKNGVTSDRLDATRKAYAQAVKGKYFIIRSDFCATAESIAAYVENFIHKTGKKPVVVVDYLQLLSPPDDFKGDTRAAIDLAIKRFKQLQLDNELLVLLISNFNRASYDHPVCQADFKESGAIEYTSDYLWGMQLSIMSEEKFYIRRGKKGGRYKTTDDEKSKMLEAATKANPREVQLVSLKNRNGTQRFTCNFKYYIKNDAFIPDLAKDEQDKLKAAAAYMPPDDDDADDDADDDFITVEDDMELPFDVPVN